jgi:hypothetical protein
MNRCVLGLTALCGVLEKFDNKYAKAGEGFYIRMWSDGSGALMKEFPNLEPDQEIYVFRSPADLWTWLHASPKDRARMEKHRAAEIAVEEQKLSDYVLRNASGKVQ